MEEELHELKAPSGDVYQVKRLKYRARKAAQSRSVTSIMEVDEKKNKKMTQKFDAFKLQEEMAWQCIIQAPWLKDGQKCTIEMLDNIKAQDIDALDEFIDKLNFPQGDVLEKSVGQSGAGNPLVTQK